MYKSYITVALRNFWKDRNYAIANLVGLAVGFACVLMIVAYVRYELSFDTTYSNAPNIYRCVDVHKAGGTTTESVAVPEPLGKTLTAEYPEIVSFTSLGRSAIEVRSKNNELVTLPSIVTDSNFFKVINLPFLFGNATALKTDGAIVISESAAKKLYPGKNPIGLSLTEEGAKTYIVTGVMKDLPTNIHFSADVIIGDRITSKTLNFHDFWRTSVEYILLRQGASVTRLESKMAPFYKKYNFERDKALRFQPVTSIHLHSNLSDEQFANSDIKYVYLFSAIALLILFIACINYVNLTTARSLPRIREVGVRKVMGAMRGQLALQFLAESFLFFAITLPVAVLLAKICWPFFANLLHLEASVVNLLSVQTVIALLIIGIFAGVLSGLYPAFFLSSLQPVNVLKGWRNSVNINLGLRKSLIVLQFVVSAVLIIATIVVQLQLHFINNLNLGFNKEHLIVLPYVSLNAPQTAAFKQELLSYKNVSNISLAGTLRIGEGYGGRSSMSTEDNTKEWNFAFIDADFDFIKTMQIPILQGRDFSLNYGADRINPDEITDSLQKKSRKVTQEELANINSSRSIIITKKTAELIDLKKPYVGQIIQLGALDGTVIGVIGDFKGISLKEKNPAIVLRAYPFVSGFTFIRINSNNVQQTLAYIEKVWKQFFPQRSFHFSFVDERIQSLYDSEQRLASFFGIFATLGIGIACLGLFSLVALIVQQRTKEIGIRKVLGAGIKNIVQLLSADFIKLIIISIVIAFPVAGWAMNKWLQDYESRIRMEWWIFALAGVIVIIIAFITISVQAARAALTNPIKSLRTE